MNLAKKKYKHTLNCNIKTIIEKSYSINNNNGILSKAEPKREIFTYDTMTNYNKDGLIIEKQEITTLNDLNEIVNTFIFEYLNNKISKEYNYSKDGNIKESIFYFYNNNKLKSKNIYDNNKLKFIEEYEYDKQDLLLKLTKYNNHNKIIHTRRFSYDKNKNLILEELYNSRNKKQGQYEYKYFIKKEQLEKQYFYNSQLLKTEIILFDASYNDIKIIKHIDHINPYGVTITSFDSKGNILEEKSDDNFIKYEYSFDQKCNWVKRIEFNNQIPKLIVERDIIYF